MIPNSSPSTSFPASSGEVHFHLCIFHVTAIFYLAAFLQIGTIFRSLSITFFLSSHCSDHKEILSLPKRIHGVLCLIVHVPITYEYCLVFISIWEIFHELEMCGNIFVILYLAGAALHRNHLSLSLKPFAIITNWSLTYRLYSICIPSGYMQWFLLRCISVIISGKIFLLFCTGSYLWNFYYCGS